MNKKKSNLTIFLSIEASEKNVSSFSYIVIRKLLGYIEISLYELEHTYVSEQYNLANVLYLAIHENN